MVPVNVPTTPLTTDQLAITLYSGHLPREGCSVLRRIVARSGGDVSSFCRLLHKKKKHQIIITSH